MTVSSKIRALLKLMGKENLQLAQYLKISKQSMGNKLSRDSFSAEDLIKVADFLGCDLAFIVNEKMKIVLDKSDIRPGNTD
jgi:transcriptional regulator with XRE-family HTH domain